MKNNFDRVREKITAAAFKAGRDPGDITLVAVCKRVGVDQIKKVISAGQTVFGENYLQEAQEKIQAFETGIEWHFIGHFQSNKAKQVAELFDVVETLDRFKVAQALEKKLAEINKTMPVYVQVNIGREEQKGGVLPGEVESLVRQVLTLPHLDFVGLMAMPPYFEDPEKSRPYFRELRLLAENLAKKGVTGRQNKLGLSMGMSGDFEVAIEEGSTLVRVGTALFGERGGA